MTAGLIVNPKSGKGRGQGLAVAEKLAGRTDVEVAVLDRFEKLLPSLEEMGRTGIRTLFISSGDGTVQQIQTELAERELFAELPDICLLPHGTTNLTAADLGLGINSLDRQARLVADAGFLAEQTVKKSRATLRVANPADGKVRHGMFLGSGAVWRGTVFCQEAVHRTGLRGDWATFATLAAAVVRSLVGGGGDNPDRIVQPYPMKVDAGGGTVIEGGQLLFLATTLDKLILGSRPFWGEKSGAIRASIFPHPPPNIPRWLRTSLYGAPDRKMPKGCLSFSGDEIGIETACPFVIDGEFFDPPASEALRIEKGPEFTYLCAS